MCAGTVLRVLVIVQLITSPPPTLIVQAFNARSALWSELRSPPHLRRRLGRS